MNGHSYFLRALYRHDIVLQITECLIDNISPVHFRSPFSFSVQPKGTMSRPINLVLEFGVLSAADYFWPIAYLEQYELMGTCIAPLLPKCLKVILSQGEKGILLDKHLCGTGSGTGAIPKDHLKYERASSTIPQSSSLS